MAASLALRNGVVWVCRSAGITRFAPYDLGGRRIGRGFEVPRNGHPRGDVRGIAVDEDRRIWAADGSRGSVRVFSAFGAESAGIAAREGPQSFADAAGIAVQGAEADLRILLSVRGERRHALFLVDPGSGSAASFRPRGDPAGSFSNLAGVAFVGRMAFACEPGRGTVQVFRDFEFHFEIAWRADGARTDRFVPRAVAAASDGRSIVAGALGDAGILLHFDAGGRLVRRLDQDLVHGPDGLEDDVCGVVLAEGATERESLVLVLDRGGDRVLAFSLDGRSVGDFHDLEVHEADAGHAGRDATGEARSASGRSSLRPRRR